MARTPNADLLRSSIAEIRVFFLRFLDFPGAVLALWTRAKNCREKGETEKWPEKTEVTTKAKRLPKGDR